MRNMIINHQVLGMTHFLTLPRLCWGYVIDNPWSLLRFLRSDLPIVGVATTGDTGVDGPLPMPEPTGRNEPGAGGCIILWGKTWDTESRLGTLRFRMRVFVKILHKSPKATFVGQANCYGCERSQGIWDLCESSSPPAFCTDQRREY